MNTNKSPEVFNLIDSIEFQSEGIVSKQLLKKDNGNVTLFAFDEQEYLTEHTSKFDALAFILEGEMEFTIGGKVFNVKSGEVVTLPANVPHALKAQAKVKMLLIMIK